MAVLPGIVSVVALIFSMTMLYQFAGKRRPHQLIWTVSLLLGAIAGGAFVLFLSTGRNVTWFVLYYICGALLMAAYLGLGSIYLLAPRKVATWSAVAVILLSVAGIVSLLLTPIRHEALAGPNVEAGTHAVNGLALLFIVLLNTFGAVAVIGGALYSAWRLWRRDGPARLLVANVLIAAGTILASLAGTLARVAANGSAFWLLLALGFVVLFCGFLLTSMRTGRANERTARAQA